MSDKAMKTTRDSETIAELTRLRDENRALQEENAHLKELRLRRMEVENGSINFSISGEAGMAFAAILLRFYEDNGGKNFFSFDVEKEDMRFNITIRNLNGELSPVEKLQQMHDELETLQQEFDTLRSEAANYKAEADHGWSEAGKAQEALAQLTEREEKLKEGLQMIFGLLEEHQPTWYLKKHYHILKELLQKD
jgi:septal ring factor EnvC (AmiA/AmiB activator)